MSFDLTIHRHHASCVATYFDDRITRISYDAETKQLSGYRWRALSYDEARNLLEKVFANYKKTSTPELVLLNEWQMEEEAGLCADGSPAAACYSRNDHTIYCQPECLTVKTILHEAAHALTPGRFASHGRAFRKKRDVLLRRHAKVSPKEIPSAEEAMDRLEPMYDAARRVIFSLVDLPAYDKSNRALIQKLKALTRQMEEDQDAEYQRAKAERDALLEKQRRAREEGLKSIRELEARWGKKETERKRRRAKQDAEWKAIKRRWAKEDAVRAEKDPEWARKVADAQRELERLVLEGKVMLKQKDEGESEV